MSISKVKLPNNTEEDIKAKYLIQSSSSDAISAEFSARTVSDDAIANIRKIYGNTYPWNQLIKNGNFSDSDNYWSHTPAATVSVASNSITLTLPAAPSSNYSYLITTQGYINVISGHKYYFHAEYKPAKTGTFVFDWNGAFSSLYPTATANTWNNFSYLLSGGSNVTGRSLSCYPREVTDGYAAGDTFSIRNVMLIDLTAIYGSGNEPTVAEFEAQYPASYCPYDPGSLTSNSATAILSRGFNQWDEEWELGALNTANGTPIDDSGCFRSKNFIAFVGSRYYAKANSNLRFIFYDAAKNFLTSDLPSSVTTNNAFDLPAGAVYGKFYSRVSPTTYNHDICINLSDTAKNGTYEPYNGYQIDLNIPTLTGKLNGTGSSVVIFPEGMGYDGVNRDELTRTTAKKIGDFVDLGSLSWGYNAGSSPSFYTNLTTKVDAKGICPLYTIIPTTAISSAGNMTLQMRGSIVYVVNSSYTDAASFKTAMSGVMLYYELATPQEYTLDNALQFQYPVIAGGTEMVLPTNGTAPMKMDVIYGNAADATSNLSSNFISVDSMKAFLNNLGTQMGGTWNMQYNNGKFEFTFSSS